MELQTSYTKSLHYDVIILTQKKCAYFMLKITLA